MALYRQTYIAVNLRVKNVNLGRLSILGRWRPNRADGQSVIRSETVVNIYGLVRRYTLTRLAFQAAWFRGIEPQGPGGLAHFSDNAVIIRVRGKQLRSTKSAHKDLGCGKRSVLQGSRIEKRKLAEVKDWYKLSERGHMAKIISPSKSVSKSCLGHLYR